MIYCDFCEEPVRKDSDWIMVGDELWCEKCNEANCVESRIVRLHNAAEKFGYAQEEGQS